MIHSLAFILLIDMRLDLFLKASRLIVRRSEAQAMCDAGAVRVNGTKAKSSKEVKVRDEIEIKRRSRLTKVVVREIPAVKQLSKAASPTLYQLIEEKSLNDDPSV